MLVSAPADVLSQRPSQPFAVSSQSHLCQKADFVCVDNRENDSATINSLLQNPQIIFPPTSTQNDSRPSAMNQEQYKENDQVPARPSAEFFGEERITKKRLDFSRLSNPNITLYKKPA